MIFGIYEIIATLTHVTCEKEKSPQYCTIKVDRENIDKFYSH